MVSGPRYGSLGAREQTPTPRRHGTLASMGDRECDLDRLYTVLDEASGGPVLFSDCQAVPAAPGVYFFFEQGEVRRNGRPRVVRVGKSETLRSRLLDQHLNGTHRDNCFDEHGPRSSVFRHHIGLALIVRHKLSLGHNTLAETVATWSRLKKSEPSNQVEWDLERVVESRVTQILRAMSVAWVVTSNPARIEKHLIGLLSSADSPSAAWLGSFHSHEKIRESGLWNIKDVGEDYDPHEIDLLGR